MSVIKNNKKIKLLTLVCWYHRMTVKVVFAFRRPLCVCVCSHSSCWAAPPIATVLTRFLKHRSFPFPLSGMGFPVAQLVKNLPVMWDTWVRSLGWEDALEKGKATHSSILVWKIPWMEEPGGLQSMGSHLPAVASLWIYSSVHGESLISHHTSVNSPLMMLSSIKPLEYSSPSYQDPDQNIKAWRMAPYLGQHFLANQLKVRTIPFFSCPLLELQDQQINNNLFLFPANYPLHHHFPRASTRFSPTQTALHL